MSAVEVVLVDDQALVRVGIAALLAGADGGRPIEVVGEASDGGSGVAVVRRTRPHVVLMDLRMPGTDGITATTTIRADPDLAGTAVLILTTFDTDLEVLGALRAGADGYLLKDTAPGALRAAVRDAADGRAVLSPEITRQVMGHAATAPVAAPDPRLGRLSARELDVLAALAHGDDNATIAGRLHLSPETVRTYVSRLLTKLDAGSRARLVAIAHRSGLG